MSSIEVGDGTSGAVIRRRWLPLSLLALASVACLFAYVGIKFAMHHNLEIATEGARNVFRTIVITRQWSANHGGVYVLVGRGTEPNPYLDVENRDITDQSGRKLTLINPAFMTRQINELAARSSGLLMHLTSLNPIRPGNKPDEWEAGALRRFEQGVEEVTSIEQMDGKPVLRYMGRLMVTSACLQCHEKQGYKLGDVRGGIGITLDYTPYIAAARQDIWFVVATNGLFFIISAILATLLLETLRQRWNALDATVVALKSARDELARSEKAAEAATQAKSVFLASMSHEIRTPMNAILGMAALMKRSGVAPGQAGMLKNIDAAGQHLLGVINNILDLSKIEAGKLVLDEADVDLAELVANVKSILAERAREKNLILIDDPAKTSAHLVGDPTRLRQALLNYGYNAIKFTERGTVTLRTKIEEDSENSVLVRFEVQDTGTGIDEESAKKLFADFVQADASTTRNHGGTGLGLAITKRFAELMGGEAGLETKIGQGSTFWFTARLKKLKVSPANSAETELDAEQLLAMQFAGTRVLVVDDEAINREIAQMLLSDVGLDVDVAADGIEALDSAKRNRYSLIFMDMQLPRMDGLSATKEIRRLDDYAQIPIIAMTANAFVEDQQKCLDAGMNDFFTKPFDPSNLYKVVLRWLSKS